MNNKKTTISHLEQCFLNSFPIESIEEPLLPFQEYRKKNRKLGYNNLILDLIHHSKSLPLSSKKENIIKNIISDCEAIYKSLMPLYHFGIHFSLSLAGGAVRDLLLDNEDQIKDLDIVVSISYNKIPNYKQMKNQWEFDVFNFPWFAKEHKKRGQETTVSSFMNNKQKMYEIVKFLISKQHSYESCYAPSEKDNELNDIVQNSDYIARYLQGVLKINTSHLNYPVDILLTNVNPTEFINSFDFNICKASIQLVNSVKTIKKEFNFPSTVKEFLSHYVPHTQFLHDVKNKTISMDASFRTIRDVENSIAKHLPRIEAKYPAHKIDFIIADENSFSAVSVAEKQAVVRHYELSKKIQACNDTKNEISEDKPQKRNKI